MRFPHERDSGHSNSGRRCSVTLERVVCAQIVCTSPCDPVPISGSQKTPQYVPDCIFNTVKLPGRNGDFKQVLRLPLKNVSSAFILVAWSHSLVIFLSCNFTDEWTSDSIFLLLKSTARCLSQPQRRVAARCCNSRSVSR